MISGRILDCFKIHLKLENKLFFYYITLTFANVIKENLLKIAGTQFSSVQSLLNKAKG